jgi:hypothetical protein
MAHNPGRMDAEPGLRSTHPPSTAAEEERRRNIKLIWKTRVRCAMRLYAALGIEVDISTAAARSQFYVRGFEFAAMDGALVLPEFLPPAIPPSLTDRLFWLWTTYRHSNKKILIPVGVKSFAYHIAAVKEDCSHGWQLTKYFSGNVHLTKSQAEHSQALLISSAGDNNWVALLPRFYFGKTGVPSESGQNIFLGTLPVAMGRVNLLSPILAPFVMHKDNLPEAFENMIEHVKNPRVKL